MDLEQAIEGHHGAANEFARGNPDPVKALFSHRDDTTLANPFGPPVRGWDQVAEALDYASSRFREGEVTSFESVALVPGCRPRIDLGGRAREAKVGGRDEVTPFVLRVTTTFRREDDVWKLVHRHADPISTPDPEGPLRAT